MRSTFLVASILALIVAGYLIWFTSTHTSVLEVLNVFQPSAEEAPSRESLTPVALPDAGTAFALVEKPLAVPPKFAVPPFDRPRTLRVPRGATISVFVAGLGKARFMAVSPPDWPGGGGVLYLTESDTGRVLAFPDRDRDGVADEVVTVASGLDYPHGIAFHDGALFVATTTSVWKLSDTDGDLRADRREVIIRNLPRGGNHISRTIAFGPDGKLYVSVGSSCNVCEDDPRRAAILRFNADGSGEEIFAEGLRNSVGIVFGPGGDLWGTENGRDFLGDDVPPDEINIIREHAHYGWPYCYAAGVADRTFRGRRRGEEDVAAFCATTEKPVVALGAHVAPLGLRFLDDPRLPEGLRGDLLVALHGSWNRTVPTGYEVVWISGLPHVPLVRPFVSGFLVGSKAWGRPVDVIIGGDGAIFISDDAASAVYRLTFAEP